MTALPPLPADVELSMRQMIGAFRGMMAMFDDKDCLRWSNPAFREAFALAADERLSWAELIRRNYAKGIGTQIVTDDFEQWLNSALSRRAKQTYRQFEASFTDGRWVLMTETMDERGWMLCVAIDVSEFGCENRELRASRDVALRANLLDALTGLANRSAVFDRLHRVVAESPRPLNVALLDLDHFKQINDQFGHAAGDQVLRHFGRLLREGLRHIDTCGRIGGEEFLIALGGLTAQQAVEIIDRVLANVRESQPLSQCPGFRFTASVGMVQARDGERPDDILLRADVALYQAKRNGRDRCVMVLD